MKAGPTPFTLNGIPKEGSGVRIPGSRELMQMCSDPKMQEALDLAWKAEQETFPEIQGKPSAIKHKVFNMMKHNREVSMMEDQNRRVIDEAVRRKKNNEIVH